GAMPDFDVMSLGASGNGTDNDADVIQRVVNDAAAARGRVRISQGTFAIATPITIPSYSIIEWDNNAYIVARPRFVRGQDPTRALLELEAANNVTLINPRLNGNLQQNSQPNAPGYFGIKAMSSSNLTICGGHIFDIPVKRTADGSRNINVGGD